MTSCLPFVSTAGLDSSSPHPVPTLISSHFRVLIFFFSFSLIFQSVGFHFGTLIDLLNFFRFRSIFCSAKVLVGPRLSSTTSFTRRCSKLFETSNTPSPVLESREELQLSFMSNTFYGYYCSNISSSSSSPFQNLSLETLLLTLARLIVLTFISPVLEE